MLAPVWSHSQPPRRGRTRRSAAPYFHQRIQWVLPIFIAIPANETGHGALPSAGAHLPTRRTYSALTRVARLRASFLVHFVPSVKTCSCPLHVGLTACPGLKSALAMTRLACWLKLGRQNSEGCDESEVLAHLAAHPLVFCCSRKARSPPSSTMQRSGRCLKRRDGASPHRPDPARASAAARSTWTRPRTPPYGPGIFASIR
jgi:hypothetical protein